MRHFVDHQAAIDSPIAELIKRVPIKSTNVIAHIRKALFAHCSTKLHYIERQHPFNTAALSDEDVSVDFSAVTTPRDRVAVIVTEPLTTNEQWTALQAGELKVFVDGRVLG